MNDEIPAPTGPTTASATINAGTNLSTAVDCTSGSLVRVYMPAQWTEAPLTLAVSADGVVPFLPVFSFDGSEVKGVVVPGSTAILIPDFVGRGLGFIKFRSGTWQNPINQVAARVFTFVIS